MRSTLSLSPLPRLSIDALPQNSLLLPLYNKQQDSIESISSGLISEDQTHQSFKLPPLTEKPKKKSISSNKLKLFIDLGLSPNVKLSHEDLIKFKNAKKKTITISDFMRKSDQQRLLASHKLSNVFNFQDEKKISEISKNRTLAEFVGFKSNSSKKSGSFQMLPFNEYAESESSNTFDAKYRKEEGLKKIEKILESCDSLLHSTKNTNKPKRVLWRRSL